jgi:acyl dehydratase
MDIKFKVGERAKISAKFSEQDVLNFSLVSGDENPIHFDEEYAAKSRFGQRIVQGPMVISLVGGVLGSKLPGPGTIYLSQETSFKRPAFIDQPLTAQVEILHIREDKPIITLRTWVENEKEELVVDGKAVVMFL